MLPAKESSMEQVSQITEYMAGHNEACSWEQYCLWNGNAMIESQLLRFFYGSLTNLQISSRSITATRKKKWDWQIQYTLAH